jgi:hypothetical protein
MIRTFGSRLACAVYLAAIAIGCSDSGSSDAPMFTAGSGGAAGSESIAGAGAAGAAPGGMMTGIAGTSTAAGAGAAGRASAAGSGGTGTAGAAGSAAGSVAAGAGAAGTGSAGMGAAGMAGAAGGGDVDGLGAKPPFMATGMPIMAPDKMWTWVPFSDTKCRGGTPAGISVNLNSASKRVMIYLEGGGACFDSQTCGSNPDTVSSQNPGSAGIFARTRTENPVKDWNYVYVPYCTGDVHMGAKDDGQVEGVTGTQHFMGRANLTAFLHRVIPTFPNPEKVLLTGVSAGGFGASSNAAFVQYAFGSNPVTVIDDSGPTFSNKYLPTCLTQTYAKTWGLEQSILEDCGSACSADADYSVQFLDYSAKRSEGRFNGLIESDQDSIIRGFFGIGTNNGANDCMGVLLVTSMSADDFLAGLLEYRERVKPYAGFSTFYPSSTQHTWLGADGLYTAMAGSVTLVDWVQGIIDGKPAMHAGH